MESFVCRLMSAVHVSHAHISKTKPDRAVASKQTRIENHGMRVRHQNFHRK